MAVTSEDAGLVPSCAKSELHVCRSRLLLQEKRVLHGRRLTTRKRKRRNREGRDAWEPGELPRPEGPAAPLFRFPAISIGRWERSVWLWPTCKITAVRPSHVASNKSSKRKHRPSAGHRPPHSPRKQLFPAGSAPGAGAHAQSEWLPTMLSSGPFPTMLSSRQLPAASGT